MPSAITQAVIQHLEALRQSLQEQVLSFVHALGVARRQGVPGSRLVRLAGTVPPAELDFIQQATRQGCEQVDLHEW